MDPSPSSSGAGTRTRNFRLIKADTGAGEAERAQHCSPLTRSHDRASSGRRARYARRDSDSRRARAFSSLHGFAPARGRDAGRAARHDASPPQGRRRCARAARRARTARPRRAQRRAYGPRRSRCRYGPSKDRSATSRSRNISAISKRSRSERPRRSSRHTTSVSPACRSSIARSRPERDRDAPDAESSWIATQPAARSASSCSAVVCSSVETRAYPTRRGAPFAMAWESSGRGKRVLGPSLGPFSRVSVSKPAWRRSSMLGPRRPDSGPPEPPNERRRRQRARRAAGRAEFHELCDRASSAVRVLCEFVLQGNSSSALAVRTSCVAADAENRVRRC